MGSNSFVQEVVASDDSRHTGEIANVCRIPVQATVNPLSDWTTLFNARRALLLAMWNDVTPPVVNKVLLTGTDPSPPSPPRTKPVVDEEPLSCQFHIGPPPPPSCENCVLGCYFCPTHLVACKAVCNLVCPFCKRVLCRRHEDCFCVDSETNRDEMKTRKNRILPTTLNRSVNHPSHFVASRSVSLTPTSKLSKPRETKREREKEESAALLFLSLFARVCVWVCVLVGCGC